MKMNLRDIFIKIEHDNQLLSSEIDGCLLWSYSRNYIYQYFFRKLHNHNDAHEKLSIFEQIKRYSSSLPHIVFNYIYLKRLYRTHKATLVFAHPRRNLIDGKYISIYTDMIIPDNWNTFTFEQTYTYKHFSPAFSPNLIYLDVIEIKSKLIAIYEKFVRRHHYKQIADDVSRKILPYISILSQETAIPVDANAIVSLCVQNYYLANVSEKYWDNLVKKSDIERIIEVVGYSIPAKALNRVAKKNKIETFEIQHGMLSKEHMGYQYHEDDKCELTPNCFLSFSDFWNTEINMPDCRVKSIGFEYFNSLKECYIRLNNRTGIVILSQMNVGKQLVKIAKEIESKLETEKLEIPIFFKLHPSEFNSARLLYPELFIKTKIQVITSEQNIYQLFSKCNIQIAYNSTALFEGLGYSLRTFLLNSEDTFMKNLVNEGFASFIGSVDEIVEACNNDCVTYHPGLIWKPNTKQIFIQEIQN